MTFIILLRIAVIIFCVSGCALVFSVIRNNGNGNKYLWCVYLGSVVYAFVACGLRSWGII